MIAAPMFLLYKELATPAIKSEFVTEHGTMYSNKKGRIVFIPKSDTGLFADDQAKTIWLASCVTDSSLFCLNGYLKVAMERRVK
jgi:hypothetical protein